MHNLVIYVGVESFILIAGIYSPNAYRGFACEFINDLERLRYLFNCCRIYSPQPNKQVILQFILYKLQAKGYSGYHQVR